MCYGYNYTDELIDSLTTIMFAAVIRHYLLAIELTSNLRLRVQESNVYLNNNELKMNKMIMHKHHKPPSAV